VAVVVAAARRSPIAASDTTKNCVSTCAKMCVKNAL
jgi:hypothetical protein